MGTSGPRVPSSIDEFRALAHSRMDSFPRVAVPDTPGMRRAAVAVCVVQRPDGQLSVLVMKRAYRGRNAGQWALPGGRVEEGETARAAAVRELHEELGLTAETDDVIGVLDDFPATSGFAITPIVVALSDTSSLRPSPDEVYSVHWADLSRLAADDTPRWVRVDAAVENTPADDDPTPVDRSGLLQMRLAPKMTIHAPTGALLWHFREVVLLGSSPEATRVAHFRQPEWTQH